MLEVHMRGGFSDRNRIKEENREIQMKRFDNRTRIQIYNTFIDAYNRFAYSKYTTNYSDIGFKCYIMREVYAMPVNISDESTYEKAVDSIIETIIEGDYDDVLTVIEAVVNYWNDEYNNLLFTFFDSKSIFQVFNDIFEREYIGYRFIDNKICPISDGNEVGTIEEALSNPHEIVQDHIKKAEAYLSDRETPDYENSIKESITAVEAMCKLLLPSDSKENTLGTMLKSLNKSIPIHPALKKAFDSLYGYTNDANGIRHAGDVGGPTASFEEAKFMLVACCAFINYLKGMEAKNTQVVVMSDEG